MTPAEWISALPLPALIIGDHARISAMNEQAIRLLGAGAKDRHFTTYLRHPQIVSAVEQSLADGQTRTSPFSTQAGGRETSYEVTLAPLEGTNALLLSFTDVTPLAAARQMRRDFVANVSHELRTPLTAMMGFIDTLQGPAADDADARARFLRIMAQEASRMNRLVDDLLSLTRVESTARQQPTTKVDISEILRSVVHTLEGVAAESDVTLKIEGAVGPVDLIADADQMTQVLTNLIENAIKYGGQAKTVTATLEKFDKHQWMQRPGICINIIDQGPGIAWEHQARLTERFYRIDGHRSRSLGGTGLGLAIVKHILNRHGGRLRVTSELGKGSTFSVFLPRDIG